MPPSAQGRATGPGAPPWHALEQLMDPKTMPLLQSMRQRMAQKASQLLLDLWQRAGPKALPLLALEHLKTDIQEAPGGRRHDKGPDMLLQSSLVLLQPSNSRFKPVEPDLKLTPGGICPLSPEESLLPLSQGNCHICQKQHTTTLSLRPEQESAHCDGLNKLERRILASEVKGGGQGSRGRAKPKILKGPQSWFKRRAAAASVARGAMQSSIDIWDASWAGMLSPAASITTMGQTAAPA
ncbi:MAG: hypothetical protein FRX49_05470 [Trebouxia sp. A1-2]|nr:MAG: hypothetical protein FRX49_05470 [Trebouxia sp. A1-2]